MRVLDFGELSRVTRSGGRVSTTAFETSGGLFNFVTNFTVWNSDGCRNELFRSLYDDTRYDGKIPLSFYDSTYARPLRIR